MRKILRCIAVVLPAGWFQAAVAEQFSLDCVARTKSEKNKQYHIDVSDSEVLIGTKGMPGLLLPFTNHETAGGGSQYFKVNQNT